VTETKAGRHGAGISYLHLVLRILVGGTLLFSGAMKLPAHSQFVGIVNGYHLLPTPLGTAYALVLPWAEFMFGAYLILGILTRPSAIASVLMAVSFTVANVSAILRGEVHCASCFGDVFVLPLPYSLSIDALIIIFGLYLTVAPSSKQIFSFDSWFPKSQRDKVTKVERPGGV
jgi:uncharacterized membrane protein YphA (DoxX/SURF4 family)